jgi:hypothetical protein
VAEEKEQKDRAAAVAEKLRKSKQNFTKKLT